MLFIVMMGAPGAGKGTQARLLQARLGLPQVSTGDLFRHNLRNETELGKLAKTYMDAGELVPDSVTIAMVEDRLNQEDCASGAILDGFPRNASQAAALDELLAKFDAKVTVVPFINVESEELVTRLLKRAQIEGRADDNEDTIRNRMRVYQEKTQPLLDFYEERNLLEKLNGQQSIESVHTALVAVVEKHTIGGNGNQ